MAYGDFNESARRTASDKILRDKAFDFAKIPKCDGCKRGLALMVYKFFDKKILAVLKWKICQTSNQQKN